MEHREDRVLGLIPVVRIGIPPPPPPPAGECVPSFGSGGTHSFSGIGDGAGVQFGRGDGHSGTLGIYVLCDMKPQKYLSPILIFILFS